MPQEEVERLRDHPLLPADGAAVPGGELRLEFGPRKVGGRYVRLLLRENGTDRRFLTALQNSGRYPGQNWIEVIDIDLPPAIADVADWEPALAPYLAPAMAAVPAGGHWMIEYESEKWHSTQVGLLAGIPPLATPMGLLLHRLQSASSIKDWYFPEGGMEGSRKLQGNRALTPAHSRECTALRAAELRSFLDGPVAGDSAVDRRARLTAEMILGER